MVLQDPAGALNPRHTVYESVAEGLRVHRLSAGDRSGDRGAAGRRRAVAGRAAAARAAVPALPARAVRRAAAAGPDRRRAGAASRELLVADEPVSSLDASIRGEILALLLRLRDELGLAVLVVTHDLGLAWNIADRIAVMYLGRIVEGGPTEEVLAAPQHPYTQALLSVVPEIEQLEPIVLGGRAAGPDPDPGRCRFHPRCPALASGEAAAAGVDEACRSTPLPVLPADRGTASPATWSRRAEQLAGSMREPRRAGRPAGGAAARLYVDRRRGAASATGCCTASGSASAGSPTSGSAEPAGSPSSTSWVSRCSSPATSERRAARGVQRLPAPRLAARSRRARRRAPACGRRLAALPVPLVDLRPRRPAAARRRTPSDVDDRPGGVRAAPGRGRRVGRFRLRAPARRRAAARWPRRSARRDRPLASYPLGELVTGAALQLRRRGELQGARRELQRVLPLRPGAPRADPAGAGVRRRRRPTSTGTAASRTARAPGRSR